ncbi:MAG: ATP-binding cassette domain-containing protein [Oscillospiraceae bacterium]|nr:ATP-binding cassette domain-containing protein [Oscillospiraceae bacterium]
MNIAAFSKSYRGRCALRFPDLSVAEGSVTAVIGPNGSGKSTLAKVLAGLERADGHISPLPPLQLGYMPQKNYAFRMSLEKNLRLNGSDPERMQRLLQALQLDSLARQHAGKLSGGETAKMALARLLMRDYALLILDEPTAAMDMESTLAAEKLLLEYREKTGATILLVTHSLQQARRIADEVLFLHRGELCEQGPADRLLTAPQSSELKEFLEFYGL